MRPILPLVALCLACAPAIRTSAGESVVVERLYFGRNVAGTLGVTDSAWAAFVRDAVTPRFPAGFTIWGAEGQFRGADGRLEREPSFVLEIVHPARSAQADSAIAAVIAEYKRRFRQESVLRLVTPARASY